MADQVYRAVWKDGAFWPYQRHRRDLRRQMKEGEHVYIEFQHERSPASHRHQFAFINEAFQSLPERMGNAPFAVSAESLRKHALIATGFCQVKTVDAGSSENAQVLARYIHKLAEDAHGYAIVEVRGCLVICRTPESQSMRAMGKERFKQSKEAILNWISELLQVTPEELRNSNNENPS